MISRVAVIDKTGKLSTAEVTIDYLIEYLIGKDIEGAKVLGFVNKVKLGEAVDGLTVCKRLASVIFQPIVKQIQ
jgi:hypothetical protein